MRTERMDSHRPPEPDLGYASAGKQENDPFRAFAPLVQPSGLFVSGARHSEPQARDPRVVSEGPRPEGGLAVTETEDHLDESDGSKHIVVAVNGNWDRAARMLALVDQADLVIAADGGANILAAHGRLPHVLVGDMDSVRPETLAALERWGCRLLRHRPDKDETDTELALLEAVALGARRITVLGALGGRIDHELANILLLTLPQLASVETRIYDGLSYLFLVRGRTAIRGKAGDLVSLIPLRGDACGIVTEGLRYPLRGETLIFGPARGVSNVLLGAKASVSLQSGQLLLVHTPQDEETANDA
jgi:thiamine pyrophosphokinase